MIEQKVGSIRYYQFESLIFPGLFQGIFSRKGGVSPSPWKSLNLGGTVGDDPANIRENMSRLLEISGFKEEQLVQVRQIHSARVVKAEGAMDARQDGDAMTTDQAGLLLLMRFADCVPILFLDPVKRAIAIAHAGWKGTLKGVVSEVVRSMGNHFGTSADTLVVGIGPSIGPGRYQVGNDVIQEVKRVFPEAHREVLSEDADGVKLDLWKANEIHLRRAGVRNIEVAGICTGSDPENWFSHRAEKGRTGRFAAVIGWK